jgi:hypothetical protein
MLSGASGSGNSNNNAASIERGSFRPWDCCLRSPPIQAQVASERVRREAEATCRERTDRKSARRNLMILNRRHDVRLLPVIQSPMKRGIR